MKMEEEKFDSPVRQLDQLHLVRPEDLTVPKREPKIFCLSLKFVTGKFPHESR